MLTNGAQTDLIAATYDEIKDMAPGPMDLLHEAFRRPHVMKSFYQKDGEVQQIYLQSDRARRLLKWEAQTTLCEGLNKTVEFFRSLPGSAAHP